MTHEDASALCLDCGLCCDGTLFGRVAVDDAQAVVQAHRLPVIDTPDGSRMPLPCAARDGVLCRIYDERPPHCRSYVCELRKAVSEERVSMRDARDIIAEVRRLREVTAAQLAGRPWWTVLARLLRAGPAARPALQKDLVALERILEARFWS